MNKVVYVEAYFTSLGMEVTRQVDSGETTKSFLGLNKKVMKEEKVWRELDKSDCWVDAERLSKDIATAVTKLNKDGYEAISVTPITSGKYKYDIVGANQAGWGYGFSYTEGVTIIGKKII